MKTTFSRTLVSLAVILLASFLLVGLSFQFLVQHYVEEQALSRLKKNCAVIVDVAAAAQKDPLLSQRDVLVNLSVVSHITDTDTVICDREGVLLVCSEDPFGCYHRGMVVDRDYLQKVFRQDYVTGRGTLEGLYSDQRYVVAAAIRDQDGAPAGIVISSVPMTATKTVLQRLSQRFLWVSVLVIAVAAVFLTVFVKKFSNPLKEMSAAAVSFGHGDLKARVRIPENAPEDVQELALAFNNMAVSLEKSEYQRQEFVANVSHELKTPMTTIAGFVDGILDGTIPSEQQDYYLQIVSEETKRLNRLVRSMLDISRLQEQGGIPPEMMSRFDLSECMAKTLLSFEQQVSQKNIRVEVDLPEYPVYVSACQDYITQVIYNLMDNAVKFCPQEGKIWARVTLSSNKAYITIANEGQTIPPEELPFLFDRFHKLDKSRSGTGDSWGLGLSIVKTIVCSHGENISVTSRDGITEFTFTLTLVN